MEFDEKKGYLVLDIETTGLDYIKEDILSLSIFDPKNNKIFQKYFPLAKRKRILNSKIHGITPKFLKGANHFSQSNIDYLIKDFNITQRWKEISYRNCFAVLFSPLPLRGSALCR